MRPLSGRRDCGSPDHAFARVEQRRRLANPAGRPVVRDPRRALCGSASRIATAGGGGDQLHHHGRASGEPVSGAEVVNGTELD